MDEGNIGRLKLLGGRTSLDFANTVDWHASDEPEEFLNTYADLVAWGQHVGILDKRQAGHLLQEADQRPAEAKAVFDRAVTLREAIYRIFAAISAQLPPKDDDLTILNTELSRTLAYLRVVPAKEGYTWDWTSGAGALDRVLWPVVRDAADLLTSEDLDRVGQCSDERCGWLFMDTSRNRSRQWCSMEDCGNRAKARRHYLRRRGATGSQDR